jgi:hypothetical protein
MPGNGKVQNSKKKRIKKIWCPICVVLELDSISQLPAGRRFLLSKQKAIISCSWRTFVLYCPSQIIESIIFARGRLRVGKGI